jgi:hypothetical protein
VKLGLRPILLLVAVVLFVVAAISDQNFADWLPWGLAAFAAAFLVDQFSIGDRMFKR